MPPGLRTGRCRPDTLAIVHVSLTPHSNVFTENAAFPTKTSLVLCHCPASLWVMPTSPQTCSESEGGLSSRSPRPGTCHVLPLVSTVTSRGEQTVPAAQARFHALPQVTRVVTGRTSVEAPSPRAPAGCCQCSCGSWVSGSCVHAGPPTRGFASYFASESGLEPDPGSRSASTPGAPGPPRRFSSALAPTPRPSVLQQEDSPADAQRCPRSQAPPTWGPLGSRGSRDLGTMPSLFPRTSR